MTEDQKYQMLAEGDQKYYLPFGSNCCEAQHRFKERCGSNPQYLHRSLLFYTANATISSFSFNLHIYSQIKISQSYKPQQSNY